MINRLCFDDYFMLIALLIRVKSPDQSTRHGCVIVDKNNKIISTGYNGYSIGVDGSKMPQTRPEKYPPILHADENAILFSNQSLEDCTMFITAMPCLHCWAQIIQKRISRVVIGPIKFNKNSAYKDINLETHPVLKNMLFDQNIVIEEWKPKNVEVILKEINEIKSILSNLNTSSDNLFDKLKEIIDLNDFNKEINKPKDGGVILSDSFMPIDNEEIRKLVYPGGDKIYGENTE